jgi:hypothetical protein
MEEKPNPLKELFDELFTLLENLETQNLAVLQFLKDQKVGTDKKLGPYLERAGNASSVKWRAARVRMEYLLSPIENVGKDRGKEKAQEQEKEKPQEQERAKAQEQDKDKIQEQDKDKATNKDQRAGTDQNQAQEIKKEPNQDSKARKAEQNKPSIQAEKSDAKKAPANTTRGQSKSDDNQKRR